MRIIQVGTLSNTDSRLSYKAKYIPLNSLKDIPGYKNSENQNFWKNLYNKFPKAAQKDINKVYNACLDPNGCVNNNAVNALSKMFLQNKIGNLRRTAYSLLNYIFLNKNNSLEDIIEPLEDIIEPVKLDYFMADFIKKIFDACRDKNGYLNGKNLKVINIYADNKNKVNEYLFPLYVQGCKDENGIADDDNIEFLKQIYKINNPDSLLYSAICAKKDCPQFITKTIRDFVTENLHYFDGKHVGVQLFIESLLRIKSEENKNGIINFAKENLKYLINEEGNDTKYSAYSIFGIDGKVREENLYKLVDLIKRNPAKDETGVNTHMLEDKNGFFDDDNISEYERLHAIFSNDEINNFCWKQGFYVDNKINPKFVDYVIKYPQKTKELNYDIAREIGFKSIEDIFKEAEETNLFKPMCLLKLLKELKNNDLLKVSAFDRKIWNGDTLMFHISNIVKNEETVADYDEIIEMLKQVQGIHYYLSDKNGISFLERVIIAQNFQLLDLIKSSRCELIYNSMLEHSYNRITNQDFKSALKDLKIKFPLLEETAHQGSVKALRIIEEQLKSPFCDKKKVLNILYRIAKANNHKEYVRYLEENYGNIDFKS